MNYYVNVAKIVEWFPASNHQAQLYLMSLVQGELGKNLGAVIKLIADEGEGPEKGRVRDFVERIFPSQGTRIVHQEGKVNYLKTGNRYVAIMQIADKQVSEEKYVAYYAMRNLREDELRRVEMAQDTGKAQVETSQA